MEVEIRPVEEKDISRIMEIYSYYIDHTAITFEYEIPSAEEFKKRVKNFQKNFPYLVATSGGNVVGYAYASSLISRSACDWTVEMSIYLDHQIKHKGLGRMLYGEMERRLKAMGIVNLYAVVASTNNPMDDHLDNGSILFHEKMGYKKVGHLHRCGFKFDSWYDLIYMEKAIGSHLENPSPRGKWR